MTTEYGYYLFDIFNQMHIASVERLKAQAIGESSTPAMNRAVLKYDQLWAEWQKEYDENNKYNI